MAKKIHHLQYLRKYHLSRRVLVKVGSLKLLAKESSGNSSDNNIQVLDPMMK
jgi:hypothetical protein